MEFSIQEIIGDKREAVRAIAEQHGARNICVFGSVARGEARPDNNINLLKEQIRKILGNLTNG